MTKLPKIVICVSLVFLSLVPIRAQDKGPPAVPKRKFVHDAKIRSVYDKSNDQTVLIMEWYRVKWPLIDEKQKYIDEESGYAHHRLEIQAACAYPGRVLASTPQAIQFDVRLYHWGRSEFKSQDTPELVAIVDGEQISLGKIVVTMSRTWVDLSDGQVSIVKLSALFTYEGLLRLVKAKNVEMRFGKTEFRLQEKHLEALRDLASRMVP